MLHVTRETIQDVLKRHADENVREGAAALGEFTLLASGRSASIRRINRQPKLSAYDPSFEMISPMKATMSLKLVPEVFNGLGNCIFLMSAGEKGYVDQNSSPVVLSGRSLRVEFDLLFSASTLVFESTSSLVTTQFFSQMPKYGYSPNDQNDPQPNQVLDQFRREQRRIAEGVYKSEHRRVNTRMLLRSGQTRWMIAN